MPAIIEEESLSNQQNNNGAPKSVAKAGCLIALVVGMLGLILLASAMNRAGIFTGFLDFKPSVVVDRSYHYRVKAKYEYLGSPVDFDIVVGCSVMISDSRLTGRSVLSGMAPVVYGLRMPNGKGLVMRVPDGCGGAVTWDREPPPGQPWASIVSPNFRPFMVVYEDASKPMFGWAYATDDAYESPLSELKFISVRIDATTKEEFQRWRATEAPKNIITSDMIIYNFDNDIRAGKWTLGEECRGARRMPMIPPLVDAMTPFWPENRPDYWFPSNPGMRAFDAAVRIGSNHRTQSGPFDGSSFGSFPGQGSAAWGMMRRIGGGLSRGGEWLRSGDIYPIKSDFTLNTAAIDGRIPGTGWTETVLLDERRKGFLFCDAMDGNQLAINDPQLQYLSDPKKPSFWPSVLKVGDVPVVRLDGWPGHQSHWLNKTEYFFGRVDITLNARLGGL